LPSLPAVPSELAAIALGSLVSTWNAAAAPAPETGAKKFCPAFPFRSNPLLCAVLKFAARPLAMPLRSASTPGIAWSRTASVPPSCPPVRPLVMSVPSAKMCCMPLASGAVVRMKLWFPTTRGLPFELASVSP
jgi:hypothetical protein